MVLKVWLKWRDNSRVEVWEGRSKGNSEVINGIFTLLMKIFFFSSPVVIKVTLLLEHSVRGQRAPVAVYPQRTLSSNQKTIDYELQGWRCCNASQILSAALWTSEQYDVNSLLVCCLDVTFSWYLTHYHICCTRIVFGFPSESQTA